MRFIATQTYYRSAQICSILLFPALAISLALVQVEDRIVTDGIIKCREQAILVSPLKDTLIKSILVKPGDNVVSGQILVRLADLRCWEQELERKKLESEFLHKRLRALLKLRNEGIKSTMEVNRLELNCKSTALEIKALERNVSRLKVCAPFSGTITGIAVEPGQPVTIGTELMELASLQHKIIECKIPEKRFADLRKGQRVAVKSNLLNYLKYDVYSGRITDFEAYGFSRNNTVSFKAYIELDTRSSSALKVGTTAQCEIIVEKTPLYLRLLEGRR